MPHCHLGVGEINDSKRNNQSSYLCKMHFSIFAPIPFLVIGDQLFLYFTSMFTLFFKLLDNPVCKPWMNLFISSEYFGGWYWPRMIF